MEAIGKIFPSWWESRKISGLELTPIQGKAMFLVKAQNQLASVEDMMARSSTLNHIGILKPFLGGVNTQISQVVCGFSSTTKTLDDWLKTKQVSDKKTSIPVEVQQLIGTAYMAIEKIWSAGSTSDELADSASYHMIDNRIKINPLVTRTRQVGEDGKIPLRIDFGNMIRNTIYNKWEDNELLDFIDLLGYQAAEVEDVLGHPVLLSPHRRQLMYHRFDTEELNDDQRNWLLANADPGANWKLVASRSDPTLEKILAYQARIFMGDDAQQFA
ncbi:uncharacterized protein LOC119309095 [Triticum dicoccoides]|uniref:uncharacterized protein LOC119309095 n=1 Tax=Triticum dicoccoides TaxID=85692 RepID=UPI001891E908|nr:uncharacterized protein LOC119309095 [Triticum dicoccoides]